MAAEKSRIQWTDHTWPIVQGCSYDSPGCKNCYAVKEIVRMAGNPNPKITHSGDMASLVGKNSRGRSHWTGEVLLRDDRLDWPFTRFKKPGRIFVPSLGDLYHPDVPDWFIDCVNIVMMLSPQHTYQVLTKRGQRMQEHSSGPISLQRFSMAIQKFSSVLSDVDISTIGTAIQSGAWHLKNVWRGVSVENQKYADIRSPELLRTPAAVRFFSVEPMLESMELKRWLGQGCQHCGIYHPATNFVGECSYEPADPQCDWVIIGGESGQNARPFHIEWAISLIKQCKSAGVPVFMKQVGSNAYYMGEPFKTKARSGGDPEEWPEEIRIREFPGKLALNPHYGRWLLW